MSAVYPIVLVTGTDRFQVVDQFTAEKDGLAGDVDVANGIDEFEGTDADVVARALDAVRTPAMFGGRRLVVLRDAVSEETLPLLHHYAENPSTDVTFLLMHVRASGKTSRAFTQFVQTVAEHGVVVEAKAPPQRPRDLEGFVAELARDHGVKLAPEAVGYIAGHVGSNAGLIVGILDQLAAAHPGERIGVGQVETFLQGPGVAKTWELTDAIDAGDRGKALAKLQALLETEGLHPLQVQAALVRYVRRLLAACELRPNSPGDIEAALGMKAYPARKLYEKIATLDPRAISVAHREVARADTALRGRTGLPAVAVLEVLVVRLAGHLRSSTPRSRVGHTRGR